MGGEGLVQKLQHPPRVADDVVVGLDVFVDFRPVNVNLYDFGVGRKDGRVGSHPVGEAAAHGNEQVALL